MRSEIRIERFKGELPLEFEIISISDLYRKSKNLLTTLHRPESYDEPTNFIRYFRKHNFFTPVEFRENNY